MPELKISNATDKAIKTKENRQYKIEYKAKLDKAIMRVDKYQQNLYKPRKTSKCVNFKKICTYNFFLVRRVAFHIFLE